LKHSTRKQIWLSNIAIGNDLNLQHTILIGINPNMLQKMDASVVDLKKNAVNKLSGAQLAPSVVGKYVDETYGFAEIRWLCLVIINITLLSVSVPLHVQFLS
jgi:hypothetical protein